MRSFSTRATPHIWPRLPIYYINPETVGYSENDFELESTDSSDKQVGAETIDWWEPLLDGLTVRRHHAKPRTCFFNPLEENNLPKGIATEDVEDARRTFIKQKNLTFKVMDDNWRHGQVNQETPEKCEKWKGFTELKLK